MFQNNNWIKRDTIINLLTQEKETFIQYQKLCKFYNIDIDERADAVVSARIKLLEDLLK